jgi:soluble lytic murein transglycosylase-like protein
MKSVFVCLLLLPFNTSWAQAPKSPQRLEAEYYVAAYAHHYHVPVPLVEAIVKRESDWRPCAVSPKGAVGPDAVDAHHGRTPRSA